jgi:hypothetical protein
MNERIVTLGPGLPGWVPRLALLLAGCGAAVVLHGDGVVLLGILLALAAVVTMVPASPAPALLIAAVAISVTVAGDGPLSPVVLLEIPLLHLVHVLASITALLPTRSVVRPGAFIRPLRRFLFVQFAVFAVAGLAEILPTAKNSVLVEVIGLIAVTGLVGLSIMALTRSK